MTTLNLNILGCMSGTSLDSLDCVMVRLGPKKVEVKWSDHVRIPVNLTSKLRSIPSQSIDLLEVNRDLGIWYADSILKVLSRHHSGGSIDLISNHGQTVFHAPFAKPIGITLQLGDPFHIAARTGITTAAFHRYGDMASSGQGAPLVPIFHKRLLQSCHRPSAIHNLGGISNLSVMSSGNLRYQELIAFDTGPANLWIDDSVRLITKGKKHFDADGNIATRYSPDQQAIDRLLKHPYLKKSFPKSTGRDDFDFSILRKECKHTDGRLVATATEFTAVTIANTYKMLHSKGIRVQDIYFCGGGARNSFLLKRIQKMLPMCKILTTSDLPKATKMDPMLIESAAFAYLGYLSLMGQSLGGHWTGATIGQKSNVPQLDHVEKKSIANKVRWSGGPPAAIIPGQNWTKLINKLAI